MKTVFGLTLLAVLALSFGACEKTIDSTEKLKVTIVSPLEGEKFHNGHHLNIKVDYTDPTELHTYSLVLTNKSATSEVLNISGHEHSKTFSIDTTIVLNVADHSDFELQATATNHAGESATEHAHFHVHPN